MQVKRQRVSFLVAVFSWLILYGLQSLFLEIFKDSQSIKVLRIIFPIILVVGLIGLVLMNKFLVKDDMIQFKTRDEKISKILGYIVIVPIAVLILFDYIVVDGGNINFIVNVVASSLLILLGIGGVIYFGLIAFKKPKSPFNDESNIIDADFDEINEDNRNLPN